ncbi:MAG: hypothetical protein ACC682_13815 [Gemmatimonadota bacterium]
MGGVVPTLIAWIYAALGDRDEMFRWLDRARETGDPWVIMSLGMEEFDPYRDDPGFLDLLGRVGLSEYAWAQPGAGR